MTTDVEKTMQVDIVSPEGQIFSGKASLMVIRGALGDLGIMPGHTQLITTILPGAVEIKQVTGEDVVLFISGGILEVQPDAINILADLTERGEVIDAVAAEQAKAHAEQMLKSGEGDATRSREELMVALARLQVVELIRNRKKK
jgi:F-type H+-transporting ATPase subunit epsilon